MFGGVVGFVELRELEKWDVCEILNVHHSMAEDFDSDDHSDLLGQIIKALDDDDSSDNDENQNLEQSHLAEDFNFFVSSQGAIAKSKEPSAKDCRMLYRKLREQMAVLDERKVLIEAEEKRLAGERAQFESEVRNWEETEREKVEEEANEWKRKYLALKEKYHAERKEWKEKRSQMIRAQGSGTSFIRMQGSSTSFMRGFTDSQKSISPLRLDDADSRKSPLRADDAESRKSSLKADDMEARKSPMKTEETEINPVILQLDEPSVPTTPTKKRRNSHHKKRGRRLSPRLQPPDPPKRKQSTGVGTIPKVVKWKQQLSDDYRIDFKYNPGPIVATEEKGNGRQIVRYRNGVTGTIYDNGTKKIKNGDTTYIFYSNHDVLIEFGDGAEAYQYNDTKTVELQLPDGTKLVEFADGQKEKHMTNGDKEITFPNGTVKLLHPNGEFDILSGR